MTLASSIPGALGWINLSEMADYRIGDGTRMGQELGCLFGEIGTDVDPSDCQSMQTT